MSASSDIFQMLVTLPNLSGKDLQRELNDRLALVFEQAQAAQQDFVLTGRAEYLSRLALRARRFLKRAQGFVRDEAEDPNVTVLDVEGETGERLRDYYHDLYYAAFFAARYGMVDSNCFDCSRHADLSAIIVAYVKGRRPEQAQVAANTKSVLDELRDARSDADYVMNLLKLADLAVTAQIRERLKRVEDIFAGWRIP